jgi:antiviral helicase SKI2
MTLNADEQREIIDQILHPSSEHAQTILEDLGLAGFPSREQVHDEIREKLLTPKNKLPAHWLPTYQMCVVSVISL